VAASVVKAVVVHVVKALHQVQVASAANVAKTVAHVAKKAPAVVVSVAMRKSSFY
jgi:hypothetical protein